MNDNIQVKTGSLNVLAQPSLARCLIDRTLQAFSRAKVLTPNVDVCLVTADGVGGNEHAFQQGMWIPFHDVTVLEGAGLTLVCVDH